jgi:transglutaminase-like putative cysteine protease
MTLDRAFRLSSILLAATGFASLTLAIALPFWLLVLSGAAFAVALLRVNLPSGLSGILQQVRLSALTWNIFLLLAFAGFWIDLLLVSQELLPAGIHFLVLLLVNKLSNLDQRRDFLHLYAISLITLLASAALTTQIWYAPFFFVYLVAGVWTLLLYHLLQEHEESTGHQVLGSQAAPLDSTLPHMTARFFWTTNAVAAGAFGLTLLFFFSIPRVGVGLLQHSHGESLRTTGFSEQVDLGVIGPVKQDPSIVMRVELPDSPGTPSARGPLYLRGVAYNRYDGKSWSNNLLHRRMLTELPQGTFTLRTPGAKPPPQARALRQDILLEPLDTAVLFGAPLAFAVKGDFHSVQSDLMGSLHLAFPAHSRIQYTVYSVATTLNPAERVAAAVPYPEFILQQYLQIPAVSPQIVDLAHRVTQPATSVSQAVSLIHSHLLANYRYNLDVPSLQSAHPLEDFLLTRKTGYCEHYATAMVVLLRATGIPARLVTGFLATEWNEFGGYYTVRQRDAHAWVEVYFPQSGWITMDPTPPAPESIGQTWWQSAGRVMDSVRLQWDRLFVHFSANDQLTVVQGLRESGVAVRTKLSESLNSLSAQSSAMFRRFMSSFTTAGMPEALLVIILAIGAATAGRLLRRSSRNTTSPPDALSAHQRTVVTLYTHMLHCLAQQGIVKSASTTPMELLRHVQEEWAEAWPFADALTQLYTRVRFGHASLTPEDHSTAENLLRRLRTLERATTRSPQ